MLTRRIASALASSRGLFLTAVLAGSITGLGFLGIAESNHVVTAQFRDADGLVVGNEVRVAGVTAGSVKSIRVTVDPTSGQQYAEVQMQVDSAQWPLHQGTSVAVKPKGVLSNVFVDLQPGPVGNPRLGDQPFFALNKTQSPVGLDELSNVFDPSVRDSIRTQLQEGVLALGGDGASNLNQTLFYANPLTRDAIPVTYVLAQRSPQLDKLNFEFNTISAEIAREDSHLRPLIINLNTLLAALAARETDLQGTLDNAAGFFTKLDTALASVTTPDPKNANNESDLARFFEQGPQALSCAATISTYFTPLVQQVNPHIQSLDVLLGEFVTATGYNSASPAPGSGQIAPVDTLRVDATLPPQNDPVTGNGGLSQEHGGSFLEGKPLGFPATISVPNFSNTCAAPAALAGVTP